VLLIPESYLLLWHTAFGLRLRACGENPAAADSLGVPVYRLKYLAVIVSGALAGLGGVFLVFVAGIYREGQTGGRGFIGLAALIFGNWRPGGLAAGAGLFGFADALQLRSQTAGGPAAAHRRPAGRCRGPPGGAPQAGAGGAGRCPRRRRAGRLLTIVRLPEGIVFFTPHLTTLLVLSLASQRLRMPKADGLVYRRGEH
jgi:simple sugar transport system permease protein